MLTFRIPKGETERNGIWSMRITGEGVEVLKRVYSGVTSDGTRRLNFA